MGLSALLCHLQTLTWHFSTWAEYFEELSHLPVRAVQMEMYSSFLKAPSALTELTQPFVQKVPYIVSNKRDVSDFGMLFFFQKSNFYHKWMNIYFVNSCEWLLENWTLLTSQSAEALDINHLWKLKTMSISKCQASFSFIWYLCIFWVEEDEWWGQRNG